MSGDIKVKWADLRAQYGEAYAGMNPRPEEILGLGNYIGGEPVAAFEKAWAEYCEVPFAIGVSSGTDALTACFMSVYYEELAHHDFPRLLFVLPANTFVATANAAMRVPGAELQFIDCDAYYQMSTEELLATLRSSHYWDCVVIVPVHMYGHLANVEKIRRIADASQYRCVVVEDASHAHGAVGTNGRVAGALGNMAAFSCFPTKPLGAAGDAGIVTTTSPERAKFIRSYCNMGRKAEAQNDYDMVGYTNRMDAVQATILRAKLKWLDSWRWRRNQVAQQYSCSFSSVLSLVAPCVSPNTDESAWYAYPLRVTGGRRDALQQYLRSVDEPTKIYYPQVIPDLKIYANKRRRHSNPLCVSLCRSRMYSKQLLCLPIHEFMSEEQTDYVCRCVLAGLAQN